jgi:hypothetical protein
MPREEWKRKPAKERIEVAWQGRPHLQGPSNEAPKTSVRLIKKAKRENLTLYDWMTVYSYVDTLPQPINQGEVVRYFATRSQGVLFFSQATLSRKLRQRPDMEACVESHPNAMSSKRPRIVTSPDVDRALWLWVQQMNQKGEVVNGIGQCLDVVDSGDMEIVAMVRAKAKGDIEEIIDSDSDEDNPKVVPPSLKEMIAACRMLEENGLLVCTGALDTVEAVRQFRGHLQKMSREGEKQTTLDMFLVHK